MAFNIYFKKVGYVYQPNSPFEFKALTDISLSINKASVTAIIGHTGSGKSTLLQHLNALIKPTSGVVKIGGQEISNKTNNKNLKYLRQKVGIVFQFSEAQLFEETVLKDVAFGPQNFGFSKEEAEIKARFALKQVGIAKELFNRSPFELSGGQMRRVAIAGILAINPDILVLDEPTTGLDPKGKMEMMAMFYRLHKKYKTTLVLVSHSMDDVVYFADFVYVLEKGKVIKAGTPAEIFADSSWLKEKQIELPTAGKFSLKLQEKGIKFKQLPLTIEELTNQLVDYIFYKQENINE
ncbi:MAG: energy-coupling factor ABC transporter ATP-binding protein [Streptococcaceae bacterium]|nr:energy-coupling factor ABC transporter ATP-binding protein [Streptococcaceae bacterium]